MSGQTGVRYNWTGHQFRTYHALGGDYTLASVLKSYDGKYELVETVRVVDLAIRDVFYVNALDTVARTVASRTVPVYNLDPLNILVPEGVVLLWLDNGDCYATRPNREVLRLKEAVTP